jgi:hypothetical protein
MLNGFVHQIPEHQYREYGFGCPEYPVLKRGCECKRRFEEARKKKERKG